MNYSKRSLASCLLYCILLVACVPKAPVATVIPTTSQPMIASPTPPATATHKPALPTPVRFATRTVVPPTATAPPISTPTEIPVFWDDFSNDFLPGWSWIRENDALWSLTSEPGFLRIVLNNSRPPRNLLVREVTLDNFQISTHVLFEPTSNFQFAGLLVYQDDDTIVSLGRAYCDRQNVCVGNGIYFDATQSGQYIEPNFGTDTQVKDEAYLRIDKVGSLLKGYYSEEGSYWMLIGEHEVSMFDPKVGLITANSFVVGMVAKFDYFTVVEMP